jgi:sugar diacid utilization regulator
MAQRLAEEALREELARKDRELRLVAEVSDMIGRAAPLRDILDRVAAAAADILATPYAAILLLTLDGRQLTIEGSHGLAESYINAVNRHGLQLDGPEVLPSLEVCRSRRPQVWRDLSADPRVGFLHEAQRLQGVRAMVVVPLNGPDGPIGTLNCYHSQAGHFGPDDVELLVRAAAHAAQAIHNARLIEQLSATVRRLSETQAVIQRQNAILTRSDAIHRRLSALMLDEQGLEPIVRTLADLLGCGVQLYDARLAPLTAAPPPPGGPAAVRVDPRLLAADSALGVRPHAIAHRHAGPHLSAPALICPIGARGRTLGFLVVPATGATDGELERRALEHAATICAVELLRQRVGREVAWRQQAALLDDLLAGRLTGSAEIRLRVRDLGHALDGAFRVALVQARARPAAGQPDDLRQQLAEAVAAVARRAPWHALVVPHGERVALLLPAAALPDGGAALGAALAAAARRDLAGCTLAVGVSAAGEDPAELAGAYRQAEDALAVLANLGCGQELLCYDDLGVYALLLRSTARAELLRLAHRWLDGLASYERRRGLDLAATLECFLGNACSVQRTAAALFVHPNTVKHRLQLVAEHCGADLGDTRQLLELQLALLVRRLHPGEFAG